MKENSGKRCCIPQCQRQCPLQWWHRQEAFPGCRVKVGLLQLQSKPESSSRPTRGQTQPQESWDTPAGLCLPGPAGENPSPCTFTAPAWTQPWCPCSSFSAKPSPPPAFAAAALHRGTAPPLRQLLWTRACQRAKGLFCLLCSLGWAAKQGSWNTVSVPSDLAAMLCHCPAPPQPGGEVTSLGMGTGLGDALLITRTGLASEHGPRDIPAAFAASACPGGTASCHPLPWEHSCASQPCLFNLESQWLCSLSSGSSGCGCSGNSPKHCWQPSPGPVPGAAGLSSLHTGQKLLLLCQPCLPHGHPSDTVPPQAGTQRERESPPSAVDTTCPLQSPLTAKPSAVPNPKTTAEVSPPSSWNQAWKLRGCRVITFSAKERTLPQGAGGWGRPAVAAEPGQPWEGTGAVPPPLARDRASAWDVLMPCALGVIQEQRWERGPPHDSTVTVVSRLAYAELRDNSDTAVAKALPGKGSDLSSRAEQGPPTSHAMH